MALSTLTYFDDAEQEPMPKMITLVEWTDIKEFIIQKVKDFGFIWQSKGSTER